MRCKIQTALQHIENRVLSQRQPAAPVVSLVLQTFPPLLSGSPYPQGVCRICYRQVQIGCSFENSVNNRAFKLGIFDEGTPSGDYFRVGPLWGGKGQWVDRFCVEHVETKKRYLAFKPAQKDTESGYNVQILDDKWLDVASGAEIPLEEVQPWLAEGQRAKNQPMEPPQTICWRTVHLENIAAIRCGITYEIVRGTA